MLKVLLISTLMSLSVYSQQIINENMSLKCSMSGTKLLYINGVLNSKDNAVDSTDVIKGIIKNDKYNYDKKSNVKVSFIHNETLGALDFLEAAAQKLREQNVTDPWQTLSDIYFKTYEITDLVTGGIVLPLYYLVNSFEVTRSGFRSLALVDSDTLSKLTTEIMTSLKDRNEKIILISHSQGNLFANDAYKILQGQTINGVPGVTDFKKYERLYGNLQVASPASTNLAKESNLSFGASIKIDRDQVVNLPTSMLSNYKVALPNTSDYLFINTSNTQRWVNKKDIMEHNFVNVYLSDTLNVVGSGLTKPTSLRQVFNSKLKLIAEKFRNNCGCYKSDGTAVSTYQHINYGGAYTDFNGVLQSYEYPGGLVSNDPTDTSTVHPRALISADSVVCGNSTVSEFVRITNGALINNSTVEVLNAGDNTLAWTNSFLFEIRGSVLNNSKTMYDGSLRTEDAYIEITNSNLHKLTVVNSDLVNVNRLFNDLNQNIEVNNSTVYGLDIQSLALNKITNSVIRTFSPDPQGKRGLILKGINTILNANIHADYTNKNLIIENSTISSNKTFISVTPSKGNALDGQGNPALNIYANGKILDSIITQVYSSSIPAQLDIGGKVLIDNALIHNSTIYDSEIHNGAKVLNMSEVLDSIIGTDAQVLNHSRVLYGSTIGDGVTILNTDVYSFFLNYDLNGYVCYSTNTPDACVLKNPPVVTGVP